MKQEFEENRWESEPIMMKMNSPGDGDGNNNGDDATTKMQTGKPEFD